MKAHFVALEGPPRKGVTARVDVYVLEQRNVNGPNPEARVAAAAEQEAAPFARVDSRRVDSLDVAGTKVTLVEIRGTMKEITQMPPFGKKLEVKERPGRMQITALVPAGGPPYRVAMFGPSELVERVKPDFMRFVESLRVTR